MIVFLLAAILIVLLLANPYVLDLVLRGLAVTILVAVVVVLAALAWANGLETTLLGVGVFGGLMAGVGLGGWLFNRGCIAACRALGWTTVANRLERGY